MVGKNKACASTTVLVHFGFFEPHWQQQGMLQAGPQICDGPMSIYLPTITIDELISKLNTRHWNGRGILLHYTDPFILRMTPLKHLQRWPGPKILACGDLHHGPNPIDTLTAYQQKEHHDSVLLTFNPYLLKRVRNKLKVPVHCLAPTFFRYPRTQRTSKLKLKLLHVGSLGPHHRKRRELVQTLVRREVIPFHHTTTNNSEEAAKLYSEYALVLNIPLNNDLNHRCFEIMAAGAPQLIYGNIDLLGNMETLTKRPDLFWAQSLEEVETFVEHYFSDPRKLTNIKVNPVPYWDLQALTKRALSP